MQRYIRGRSVHDKNRSDLACLFIRVIPLDVSGRTGNLRNLGLELDVRILGHSPTTHQRRQIGQRERAFSGFFPETVKLKAAQ